MTDKMAEGGEGRKKRRWSPQTARAENVENRTLDFPKTAEAQYDIVICNAQYDGGGCARTRS